MRGAQKLIMRGQGTRTKTRRVPREDGVIQYTEDGQERYWYEVYMDERGVEHLARKAAFNRSGRSVDGPLEVVITRRDDLSGDGGNGDGQ